MFINRNAKCARSGLTLVELAMVALVLTILAGALVPLVSKLMVSGRNTAAQASLVQIRDAIMGTPDHPGFLSDTGRLPVTLTELFNNPFPSGNPLSTFNRDTGLGWRGPYLLNANGTYLINTSKNFIAAYGANGDPAVLDPWGNPFVLQRTTTGSTDAFARLVSAGPSGVIDTPLVYAGTPYPQPDARGDDIVLFIAHADSYP